MDNPPGNAGAGAGAPTWNVRDPQSPHEASHSVRRPVVTPLWTMERGMPDRKPVMRSGAEATNTWVHSTAERT